MPNDAQDLERETLIARLTELDVDPDKEFYNAMSLEGLQHAYQVLVREAKRLNGSRLYKNHFNPVAWLHE